MSTERVMLLIDADNVSLDVIEQAVPWVRKHYGGPHVLRAYCTAESAVKHQSAFKRLGIRPMVNLAAGKNSTDIALAVDAMEMVSRDPCAVAVIASSDSDFAPLVSRLREHGLRVVGIGQQGKTGDETVAVYDDYEVISHRKPAAREPSARTAAARTAATKTAATPTTTATTTTTTTATPATPAKAPAKRAAAPRKTAAKKTAAPAAPAVPDKAQAIFNALPELAAGHTVELRVAAERLREHGLLSRSGSSTKLFGQFPELFELLPDKQPNHVKRRAAMR